MIAHILIPVIAMAGLGLLFGLGLAYTLKIFGIEVDPEVALIITRLPGANCGACGKAGCAGFAEALKKGETIPAGCVVSNEEARKAISEILGIEYTPRVKTIATVLCNGGTYAADKFDYKGIRDCAAATLVFGGFKECSYGCLGFGDCERSCPFDAIKMRDDGLPEVDPDKCTACGNCVRACPKNLFVLTPIDQKCYVKCNSKDPGPVVRKVCKRGCIACGICQKLSGGVFKVEENLAKVDYELSKGKEIDWTDIMEKCPTKVIFKIK